MKKIISIGLVVVVVLGLGVLSFADDEMSFTRAYGRGRQFDESFEPGINNINGDFEPGLRQRMTEEEFEAYREGNRVNLSIKFEEQAESLEILSELTGDSVETIEESALTLHEYAENAGVLEAFQSELLEMKTEALNALVENGTITQEKADFMLDRMASMDGSAPQQRLGQKGMGRGYNAKGQGFNK